VKLWAPDRVVRFRPVCLTAISVKRIFPLMKLLNLPGRRAARSTIAWSLLAGIFVLTSTPVCGSVLDVDAVACCRRHGCVLPPSTKCKSMHYEHKAQSSMARCLSMEVETGSGSNSDQCCQRGRLIFPTAKAQAAVSIARNSNAGAAIQSLAIAVPKLEILEDSPDPYLKIPIRSLYTLTANYRI